MLITLPKGGGSLLCGQRRSIKSHIGQPMTHESADISVVVAVWITQNMVAVKVTEAGQRLSVRKKVDFGKGQYLAGPFIRTSVIVHAIITVAVAEGCRRVKIGRAHV